tara:strand:- start:242 stop:412 length:171 start_codon:yes stop_codon:yes gene_type:complete
MKAQKVTNLKKFKEKYILRFFKKRNKGRINIRVLTAKFNGKKKFITRVIKEIVIIP